MLLTTLIINCHCYLSSVVANKKHIFNKATWLKWRGLLWVRYLNSLVTLSITSWHSLVWLNFTCACSSLSAVYFPQHFESISLFFFLPSIGICKKLAGCQVIVPLKIIYVSFFLKDFTYLFLERRKGREKDREKHRYLVASHVPPTGDVAHNPGMCPDWKSNWQPFGSQASTHSTEPHQPGLC